MILAKEAILSAYKRGLIKISPFEPELVSVNSVDIRLGADLWQLSRPRYRDLYHPEDKLWTKLKPVKASKVRDIFGNEWAKGIVPDNADCFILKGGQFYIATTLEAIGTRRRRWRKSIVPEMKAKSTVGREGLTVALCAGMGDIGYCSRWALEVRVVDNGDVPIAVSTPIGQVVFHTSSKAKEIYNGKDRYQNDDTVRFLPKPLKYFGVNNET